MPRERIVLPTPYGLDKSTKVSEKEILFITMEMSRLVSSNVKKASSLNILELLVRFSKNNKNKVMIIEGDAGVGKSSLISHLCYQNEVNLQKIIRGYLIKKKFIVFVCVI